LWVIDFRDTLDHLRGQILDKLTPLLSFISCTILEPDFLV